MCKKNSVFSFIILAFCFLISFDADSQSKKTVYITGSIQDVKASDTMILRLYDHYFTEIVISANAYKDFKSSINPSGHFSFRIDNVSEPKYFQLGKDYYKSKLAWIFSKPFLMETGDSVVINIGKVVPKVHIHSSYGRVDSFMWAATVSKISFSGRGSGKYKCLYDITTDCEDINGRSQARGERKSSLKFDNDSIMRRYYYASYPDFIFQNISFRNYKTIIELKILDRYKKQISNEIFKIIKGNIIANNEEVLLNDYRLQQTFFGDYISDSLKKCIQEDMTHIYNNRGNLLNQIDKGSYLKFCYSYNDFVVKSLTASFLFEAYEKIMSNYNGITRDQMLTSYFLLYNRSVSGNNTLDLQFRKTLASVKTSYCSDILSQLDLITVNKPAFDFELPDVKGNIVKLKDYRGKVVFIDFWYTGCSNCATYYQFTVSKAEEHFRNNKDVVFITISIDSDKSKWLKSVREGIYTGNEAINLYTAGLGSTHPVIQHYYVQSYPRPLLIGKSGKIVSKDRKELCVGGTAGLISTIERTLIAN